MSSDEDGCGASGSLRSVVVEAGGSAAVVELVLVELAPGPLAPAGPTATFSGSENKKTPAPSTSRITTMPKASFISLYNMGKNCRKQRYYL